MICSFSYVRIIVWFLDFYAVDDHSCLYLFQEEILDETDEYVNIHNK